MGKYKVIAVDGPSSSGKSSVAKALANKLGYHYVDTGAMFRGIGLYFYESDKLSLNEEKLKVNDTVLKELLSDLKFEYVPGHDGLVIKINEKVYTSEIRQHFVSKLASVISTNPLIRNKLRNIQQSLGGRFDLVMDGRDIGTVIFPEADFKFFITASPEIRADRRYKELLEKNEEKDLNYDRIFNDLVERDKRDSEREVAPLAKADDAVEIDNGELNLSETLDVILEKINKNK